MASWSVISTVQEDLDVTLRFVAYHLSLGAEMVYLFFYNPEDVAIERLSKHPKVKIVRCDLQYWKNSSVGSVPWDHTRGQGENANVAYKQCQTDWCIHIDADEYILPTEGTVNELLDACQKDVLRIKPADPLVCVEENNTVLFQCVIPKKRIKNLMNVFDVPMRRHGGIGHAVGKSFVRCGLNDVQLGIHGAKMENIKQRIETCRDMFMLHYLNFGPTNWAKKYVKHIESGNFDKKWLRKKNPDLLFFQEIKKLYLSGGVEAVAQRFKQLRFITNEQLQVFLQNSELLEFEFDFSKAMRKEFDEPVPPNQTSATIFQLD